MNPTPAHDPYAAWRHRNFRFFLCGSVLASIGYEMLSVVVRWELYERTGSALDLGLVGLVQAIPILALALPAGQVADRYSRVGILLMTQSLALAASLGLAAVSYWHAPVGWIYACLGLVGVARGFAFPARWALLPELVPTSATANAVTWRSSGFQIAAVGGPALGGLALAQLGRPDAVYILDAAIAAAVMALLAGIAEVGRNRDASPFSMEGMLAGVRFVGRNDLVLAAITLDMFAVLLGGAVALLPVYARDILDVGPKGLGYLQAAPAVGALAMGLLMTHRPMKHAGRALLVSVAGFGLATIGFGLARNYPMALAMLALTGACDNISVVIRGTLVQVLTPDDLRGRVSSVNSVFINISNHLGSFESGLTARWFGPVASVVGGGVGTLLVVSAVAWKWPRLRRLGRLDTAADDRPVDLAPPDAQPA
ncbi:MAG: MFS transporter [Isosphaeraceae bacterium]